MVKDTILEEEWGEFQSAEEVDIAFEIMLLFPDLYKVHEEVQEILDQKYEEVSEQNRSNFRDIDTQGFRYPEINLEDDIDHVKRKLDVYTGTAVSNATMKSDRIIRSSEDQWKNVLKEVSAAQRDLKLKEHTSKAIKMTTEKIAILEKDVRSDRSLKPELKKQYAILEELQTMSPENQKDKTSAKFYKEVHRYKSHLIDRVQSSVNKVNLAYKTIKKEKMDKLQSNKLVAALGWSPAGLFAIGLAFPPVKPITAPAAAIASGLHSALSISATIGSDKQLAEEARSGELESLLNRKEGVYLDSIINKSPEVYSNISLAEKIDMPSSALAALGPAVESVIPGTQTVTATISYIGTAAYYSAPFYMEYKQQNFDERAKKSPQSFVDKEKERQKEKQKERQK